MHSYKHACSVIKSQLAINHKPPELELAKWQQETKGHFQIWSRKKAASKTVKVIFSEGQTVLDVGRRNMSALYLVHNIIYHNLDN